MKKKFNLKFSERVSDHLIQAFLIFFSVLFAFWLNDYRNNQIQKEQSELTLNFVNTELKNNLKTLEYWKSHHKNIMNSTEELLTNSSDSINTFQLDRLVNPDKGIFKAIITKNAHNYLQNTSEIDAALNLELNRIYQQQLYVENALQDVLNFLKEREIYNEKMARTNYVIFNQLISELYYQEEAMIPSYKSGIEKISAHLTK